jgi:hypothetical protein
MRGYTAVALLFGATIFTTIAHADNSDKILSINRGVFCQTADQVDRFVHAAMTNDVSQTTRAADVANSPCFIVTASYYEVERIKSIQEGVTSFRVVRASVVAIRPNGGWVVTPAQELFTAVLEPGMAI